MGKDKRYDRPPGGFWAVSFLLFIAAIGYFGWFTLSRGVALVPPAWNPFEPLRVADDITPLTKWKLSRTEADPAACQLALDDAAEMEPMPPLVVGGGCGIDQRITLRRVGMSALDPLQTSCPVALRMAMWERHTLQPAAQEVFGTQVTTIRQIGSYNCRTIRTTAGSSNRLSTHATAEAIDVTGFDLGDGTRIRLLADWSEGGAKATFLRAAKDGACTWFATTLSPDYNRLHADHFHLQSRGWGACR